MQITVTATAADLAAQLGWVARTLPARPVLPVLAGIHMQVAPGAVRLTAGDGDTWTHADLAAHTTGTGTLVLPGRLVAGLIARVPRTAQVTLEADQARVHISAGPVRASVMTLSAQDYPAPPTLPEGAVQGRAEAADLAAATEQAAAAAGTDQTLPVLTCIRIRARQDGIVLTGTDRYRLSQQTLTWEPVLAEGDTAEEVDVLVPARTLVRASASLSGTVTLLADEHTLALADGARTVIMRLDEGTPLATDPFRDKAAEGAVLWVEVESDVLAASLDRVALFAGPDSPVALEVGETGLVVRAGQGEDATGSEEVEAKTTGDGMVLRCNPRMLSSVVSTARADHVLLHASDPNAAVLVTPVGDERGAAGAWQIIMPVRVAGS